MGFRNGLCSIILHYSQFYFVTLAITLGSGALGLPTTLADSGFLPFLITIFASYIIQVLTMILFTEVLQKAYYRNIDKLKETNNETLPIHLQIDDFPTYVLEDDSATKRVDNTQAIERCLPNLHSLGEVYLPYFLPYLSTAVIFAELLVFLTSHILAGSQSYAVLIGVSFYSVAPIFAWVLILIIMLFYAIISAIISVLTIVKGLLFTAAIVITFIAGLQHLIPIKNDFSHTGDSFLMSLVTLGGFVSAMPLMFRHTKQTRNGIIGFNVSIFLALTTCLILCILWCWSVLSVVPQHSVCLPYNNTKAIKIVLALFNQSEGQCVKSPSLENALANGEIAPVPLDLVLRNEQNPISYYLAIITQVFVAINISVSFLTAGSVLYHTVNGVVDSFWSSPQGYEAQYKGIFKSITVHMIRGWFLTLIVFVLIFTMAFSNPKGFDAFVQQAGSLFVSIEFGFFIAIMIYRATYSTEFRSYVLPFQLPQWFLPLQYLIPLYYICCIAYNIYTIILSSTKN